MYSYEERRKAIELYIKYDLQVNPVIKELGYIDDLKGTISVSRDGGDGGYTMGIGKNADGTYANNSQRAIPKSSAEVSTGNFNVDLYKSAVDVVTGEGNDLSKLKRLQELGFSKNQLQN